MAPAHQLIEELGNVNASSFATEAERVSFRDALFDTLRKVQSPWDLAWEHNWVNPATNAAIKTLIDAGVFKKWAEAGYEPKNCDELATLTGADALLLRRMMRHLAGQNLVIEVDENTYAPTPWSKALAQDTAFPGMYGGFYHELNAQMFRTLPSYLQKTNFRNPTDVQAGNFQHWRGADATLFEYIGTNPLLTSDFNDAMECHSKYNLTPWPAIYPSASILAAAKPGRALVVDIGGGKGHDLAKFHAKHPAIPDASLVLQDLPDILKTVQGLDKAIAVHPYDFFTPQPVKGARVYLMHNVLHDWPDATATAILGNVVGAMEAGYSRLLIHESLVSSRKPLARVTTSDLTMMACMSSRERTEAEWRALVEGCGLRVVKIWRPLESVESIVEAELA